MNITITIEDYYRINKFEDMDVYDNTFDVDGVALCWNDFNEPRDNYDKVLNYIVQNVEVMEVIDSISLAVDFTGFIQKNLKAFEQFTHEKNRADFDMTEYDDEDDKIEVGIRTINNLIIGNYAESDYARFIELIG